MSSSEQKSSYSIKMPDRQTKLYRTSKGSVLSGVCSGLQSCGKGSAVGWRILFIFLGIYIFGVIGYVIMALIVPKATQEEEENLLNHVVVGDAQVSSLDRMQNDLEKAKSMKDSGLITEEEYSSLRTKILRL